MGNAPVGWVTGLETGERMTTAPVCFVSGWSSFPQVDRPVNKTKLTPVAQLFISKWLIFQQCRVYPTAQALCGSITNLEC